MAKDRARPFSRKHRRYWMTILGGMVVIGTINLLLGWSLWPGSDKVYRTPEAIIPVLPVLHDAAPATATPPLDAAPAPARPDAPR